MAGARGRGRHARHGVADTPDLQFRFRPYRGAASRQWVRAFWVAVVFATLLGLGRAAALERQDGAWEGLVLAPVERPVIYVAKLSSMLLFVALVEVVALVVMAALFGLPVFRPGVLVVLVLGTVGLCALGTLFSVMTAQAKAREVLLPALLFPGDPSSDRWRARDDAGTERAR